MERKRLKGVKILLISIIFVYSNVGNWKVVMKKTKVTSL